MDHEDPNTDPQTPDLGDALDTLLSEIDDSCAQFEKSAPENPDAPVLISDDGTTIEPPPDNPEAEAPSSPEEDEKEAQIAEEPGPDQVGNDALDALDAVSAKAESLLEETIDGLLDDEPTGEASSPQETQTPPGVEDSSEKEPESAEPQSEDTLSEALLTQVPDDVTDADPLPPNDDDEPESTVESTVEPTVESTVESTVEGVEEETLGDELLESINEELVSEIQDEYLPSEVDGESGAHGDEPLVDKSVEVPVEEVPVEEVIEPSDGNPESESESEGEVASAPASETPAESEPPTEPPTEPEPADGSGSADDANDDQMLDDLDASLADVGDGLLMGDFETPDGEIIDSSTLEEALDPAQLLDQLALGDEPKADDIGDEPTADEDETAATPVPEEPPPSEPPAPASESAAREETPTVRVPEAIRKQDSESPEDPHDSGETPSKVETIWQTLLRVSKAWGSVGYQTTKDRGGPLAASLILKLSKPLESKPASVRNSIGYVAIWTLFLASVLWVYALFFRVPPEPILTRAPTRVVEPGEDLAPIENELNATKP